MKYIQLHVTNNDGFTYEWIDVAPTPAPYEGFGYETNVKQTIAWQSTSEVLPVYSVHLNLTLHYLKFFNYARITENILIIQLCYQ